MGIGFACGFVLVLFIRTDSAKEDMAASLLLFVLMILVFAAVMALSDFFAKKTDFCGADICGCHIYLHCERSTRLRRRRSMKILMR